MIGKTRFFSATVSRAAIPMVCIAALTACEGVPKDSIATTSMSIPKDSASTVPTNPGYLPRDIVKVVIGRTGSYVPQPTAVILLPPSDDERNFKACEAFFARVRSPEAGDISGFTKLRPIFWLDRAENPDPVQDCRTRLDVSYDSDRAGDIAAKVGITDFAQKRGPFFVFFAPGGTQYNGLVLDGSNFDNVSNFVVSVSDRYQKFTPDYKNVAQKDGPSSGKTDVEWGGIWTDLLKFVNDNKGKISAALVKVGTWLLALI